MDGRALQDVSERGDGTNTRGGAERSDVEPGGEPTISILTACAPLLRHIKPTSQHTANNTNLANEKSS